MPILWHLVNITTLRMAVEETVSAADANRRFSQPLRAMRKGQSYVATSHGKPVAKLVPLAEHDEVAAGARAREELYEDGR